MTRVDLGLCYMARFELGLVLGWLELGLVLLELSLGYCLETAKWTIINS